MGKIVWIFSCKILAALFAWYFSSLQNKPLIVSTAKQQNLDNFNPLSDIKLLLKIFLTHSLRWQLSNNRQWNNQGINWFRVEDDSYSNRSCNEALRYWQLSWQPRSARIIVEADMMCRQRNRYIHNWPLQPFSHDYWPSFSHHLCCVC